MKALLNGVELGYEDTGGERLPLVLIHGFPLSRGAWRPQLEAFGTTHRVIAPDLRGFGESGATTEPTTMIRFAEDLKSLLDHLGTGPVVLAGHSMGGYIALAFARAYPQMLKGLALVGTKSGPDTPEAAAGRRATAEKVKTGGTGVVIDAMAPKMVADQALVPAVRALMQPASADGVIGALLGMAERPDSTDLLTKLGVPVWITTGLADVLIPAEESRKMFLAIPGSRFTSIYNAGHLAAYESPKIFNDALKRWLELLSEGQLQSEPTPLAADRSLEVVQGILWASWDPIGVNDDLWAWGEYDDYAPTLLEMVRSGKSTDEIASRLLVIETKELGLSRPETDGTNDRHRLVAQRIADLIH